ncbi:conjugal transfer protein TraG N-terminal domain-containing protein [Piscinibacter sakaiensis]|uniref:conjugal transfer protein TraG N-terminal domain-containing protein n=1 Tax=Piscinibacter sakaiensis TaxID=1547922 RepID=UPI003AB0CA1D
MWEIYAYQNSASLLGIFNAAAAINASGDYRAAVALVAFCGFVAALVAYAFAPEKLHGWRWLATVVLVFSTLILPRATVGIVDKVGSEGVQVVDNVPFGIAALGSITSTIGHTLTTLFETAFQTIPGAGALPSELSYQRNGLMFGNRLIRETSSTVFQDPGIRTDVVNYIQNCTLYDLADGTLDATMMARSTDIWSLISNSNPARFTTITSGWLIGIRTCPVAYVDIHNRMAGHLLGLQRQLAASLNPTLPTAAAEALIAGQIQQAYLKNRIADAATSAAEIVRQNAVINAFDDAGRLAGQRTNDPAAMVLAIGRAQATAQQNATWLNNGKVAEQALPVFRNVVEALTYALFPLMVLLLLVTSGRETLLAFKGYATVLIWIQLWPPLYAVLNYMATVYAAYDLAAAANPGTGVSGLTLQTSSTIYSRAISGEAVVGYLAISIPILAWAALKRMESMGSAMVGGLSGLQSAIGAGTGSAALGNVSLANVSMDQLQLAPNRTSAFMGSFQHDLTGNTFSSNALTGRTAVSMLRNQGFASRVVSMRVSEQDTKEAGRQVDAARSEAVAASTERSSVLAEVFAKSLTKMRSTQSSSGTVSSSFEQLGETLNRLDQISKSVSNATGLSQAQVARIALGSSSQLGLSTPLVGLQGNATAGKDYSAGLSKSEHLALGTLTSEQMAEFKQFGDRVSRDKGLVNSIASDAREASEIAARLASTSARSVRADASLSERSAFSERVSAAYERGDTISIDIAQDPHNLEMFRRYSDQYGGNSESTRVLMESELARNALKPNRMWSDGAAVPTSFSEVEARHSQDRAGLALSPDIRWTHARNRKEVIGAAHSQGQRRDPDVEAQSVIRSSLRAEKGRIRGAAFSERSKFDRNAQVDGNADGTLASGRSLLLKAGKQLKDDAASALGDAAQAAKEVLKERLD